MPILDETPLGAPLPHPDNDPYGVDVPRIRAAFLLFDGLISAMQADVDVLPSLVQTAVAEIVDGAPEAMDSFVETAARIIAGEEAAMALATLVGSKASTAQLEAVALALTTAIAAKADGTATASRFDTIETDAWVTRPRISPAIFATAAEIRQAADKAVTASAENAANAIYDVPFATTITLDGNNGRVQRITATANFTLAIPTNLKNGRYEVEVVSQGAARTMAFAAGWRFAKGKLPTLTQVAGAVDVFLIRPNGANPAIVPTAFADLKAPV